MTYVLYYSSGRSGPVPNLRAYPHTKCQWETLHIDIITIISVEGRCPRPVGDNTLARPSRDEYCDFSESLGWSIQIGVILSTTSMISNLSESSES